MHAMSSYRQLKLGIFAVGGAIVTIYGWYYVQTTNQIFNGFALAGPVCLIFGTALLAKYHPKASDRLVYAITVVAVGMAASFLNFIAMKQVYPKARVVYEIKDSADSNN